jgi:hypothetical protein
MPKRGQQQPGAKQVCDANPGYADLGPSNTVCKFFVRGLDEFGAGFSGVCTAWFVGPNLMVTAGHCVSAGDESGYFLDPSDPGETLLQKRTLAEHHAGA